MTTTVKQLKAYLETLDENLKVCVMHDEYYCGYAYTTEMVDLRLPTEENKYDVNVDVFDDQIWFGERN